MTFSRRVRSSTADLVSGNDGGLNVAAAIQHVPQHLLQTGERRFSGDVFSRANLLLGNQAERFAYRVRRVMECRLQSDLGIVQTIGVEFDFHAVRAATEEIYGSALAHHVNRPLPSLRTAHRFNDDIAATLARR